MMEETEMQQQYCFRCDDHKTNLFTVFDELYRNEDFTDVTLACEDSGFIECHKIVLAASSSYFRCLFSRLPHRHPVVVLKDVRYREIHSILEYMYKGEVAISAKEVEPLLKVAAALDVKGLVRENKILKCSSGEENNTMNSPSTFDIPCSQSRIQPRLPSELNGHSVTTRSEPKKYSLEYLLSLRSLPQCRVPVNVANPLIVSSHGGSGLRENNNQPDKLWKTVTNGNSITKISYKDYVQKIASITNVKQKLHVGTKIAANWKHKASADGATEPAAPTQMETSRLTALTGIASQMAPAPSENVPLSDIEFERFSYTLFKEFIANQSIGETLEDFKKRLKTKEDQEEAIVRLIQQMLKKPAHIADCGKIVTALLQAKAVSVPTVVNAASLVLQVADELEYVCPKVWEYMVNLFNEWPLLEKDGHLYNELKTVLQRLPNQKECQYALREIESTIERRLASKPNERSVTEISYKFDGDEKDNQINVSYSVGEEIPKTENVSSVNSLESKEKLISSQNIRNTSTVLAHNKTANDTPVDETKPEPKRYSVEDLLSLRHLPECRVNVNVAYHAVMSSQDGSGSRDDFAATGHSFLPLSMTPTNSTSALYKTVRSLLNQLTPEKFPVITEKFMKLNIDSEERLKGVIELIFEKAVNEPGSCKWYAKMCNVMQDLIVEKDSRKSFRALLLNKCQSHFESTKTEEMEADQTRAEMEALTDPEKKKKLQLLIEEKERKTRRKNVGNCRFLGELFKFEMLTPRIMLNCTRVLINTIEDVSLECLCILLSTIGKELDEKLPKDVDQFFKRLEDIADPTKKEKISSDIRSMILDVIDLRKNKWVPRSFSTSVPPSNTKIDRFSNSIFKEFIANQSTRETVDDFKERFKTKEDQEKAIVKLIEQMLEEPAHIANCGKIVTALLQADAISVSTVVIALSTLIETADDLKLTCPKFWNYMVNLFIGLPLLEKNCHLYNELKIVLQMLPNTKDRRYVLQEIEKNFIFTFLSCSIHINDYFVISKWIRENVDNPVNNTNLVEALTEVVCEAVFELVLKPKEIKDRFGIYFKKYIHDKETLELICLNTIVNFSRRKRHGHGLALAMFEALYNSTAISKDSYMQLKKNSQTEELGVLMTNVKSFYEYLENPKTDE